MTENANNSDTRDNAATLERRAPSKLLHLLIVLALIGAGIFIAKWLIMSRTPPQRAQADPLPPLVSVQQLEHCDIQMTVKGFGTVSPKLQIEIVPQVSGKVVYVNPQFRPGGFIKGREALLRIEPRDYELAVQQAQAAVADAQVKLELEQAEAQVATTEWRQLNPGKEPNSTLVIREPQVRQAKTNLLSAQAKLDAARLNLERTSISLPVDVVVIAQKVDLGQFVNIGQSIGSAYGIEMMEIEVPLEDKELAWFDIPSQSVAANGTAACSAGPIAQVKANFAGAEHTWTGCVRRTTGQIDKTSRLVSVIIEVPDPFKSTDSRPPLVPGMFVEVEISGRILKEAVAVPRYAIHNGNEVWLVKDGLLQIATIDILRTDKQFAYAVAGIENSATIVTSAIDTVTDGMRVRTADQRKNAPQIVTYDTNGK